MLASYSQKSNNAHRLFSIKPRSFHVDYYRIALRLHRRRTVPTPPLVGGRSVKVIFSWRKFNKRETFYKTNHHAMRVNMGFQSVDMRLLDIAHVAETNG